jgi:RNA polymerase sigma factor (sigma-70 family)
MSGITDAERYLLDQIRKGDGPAWEKFVGQYRGRLLRFAHAKVGQRADAEDMVQETFIGFLTGLADYRGDASPETYLFTILRRKIINNYRSAHARNIGLIQDVYRGSDEGDSDAIAALPGREATASWYVRRDENKDRLRAVLGAALTELVDGCKADLNFRDMMIIELLFYCQVSNQDTAKIVGINERNIAVIKHRCLKQVKESIAAVSVVFDDSAGFENLLTEVWESGRLSCPKRSTIGAMLLGTLEPDWQAYVDFHLNRLGCHFCRANLDDLKQQTADDPSKAIHARILQSTVGFLHKPRA